MSDNKHTLANIRRALQKKFGREDLSHFQELPWTPSNILGAQEILRIGTRDGKNRYKRGDWDPEEDLHYVTLSQPFSRLATHVDSQYAGQFRSYLRGCFALRGHTGASTVSTKLDAFTRIASIIEANRNGTGSTGLDATYHGEDDHLDRTQVASLSAQAQNHADHSKNAIMIPDDSEDESNAHANVMKFASAYPTVHPRAARETSLHTGKTTDYDNLDAQQGTAARMPSWNAINHPKNPLQDTGYGMSSEDLLSSPRRTNHSMSTQYYSRASTIADHPEQRNVNFPNIMAEINRTGITSFGPTELSATGSVHIGRTAHSSRPSSFQQHTPSRSKNPSLLSKQPTFTTDGRKDAEANTMRDPCRARSHELSEHHQASYLLNGLETLTPASRAWLDRIAGIPDEKACQEYCANLNVFTAAHPRLKAYDTSIAQNEANLAKLQTELDSAATSAKAQKFRIVDEHKKSYQTGSSTNGTSDPEADLAALTATAEQLGKVDAMFANKIEALEVQIEKLRETSKVETEAAAKLRGEYKSGMDIRSTLHLGLLLGMEAAKGTKRKRGE